MIFLPLSHRFPTFMIFQEGGSEGPVTFSTCAVANVSSGSRDLHVVSGDLNKGKDRVG
jgi:hypothetical protein